MGCCRARLKVAQETLVSLFIVIAKLTGNVDRLGLTSVVLDVNGVGYSVAVSPKLVSTLGLGQALTLFTAHIVREDAQLLFGFASHRELEVFDLLRSVTGVGPKSALSIVAAIGVEGIENAVASDDDSTFRSVSGIGPKTAKLITVSLAGKLSGTATNADSELLSALIGLGYPEPKARKALLEATGSDLQSRLKSSLAILSGAR